jgi:hypothetical protein
VKIYISHAEDFDYEKLYEAIHDSTLYDQYQFFLPRESQNIGLKPQDVLKGTDLLVAEVSHPSTSQGIELGLAAAAGVPIICFYRELAQPPDLLQFVTKHIDPYTDADGLLRQLQYAVSTM